MSSTKGHALLEAAAASATFVDTDLPIDRFIYIRYNQPF